MNELMLPVGRREEELVRNQALQYVKRMEQFIDQVDFLRSCERFCSGRSDKLQRSGTVM